jgi:predicted Zn finger-like uncharacterized protein
VASVSCPSCQKSYAVPPGLGGRKVRCKACGATITIPLETAEPVLSVDPVPVIPVAVIPMPDDADAFPSVPAVPAMPPPLPPRRPPAVFSTPPPPFAMANQLPPPGFSTGFQFRWWKPLPIALGLLLLIAGTFLWSSASAAGGPPRQITCKTLETVGSGSNHHILLTDFRATHYFARLNKGTALEYEMVPLVSTQDVTGNPIVRTNLVGVDPANIRPGSVQVVFKTTRIPLNTDFGQVMNSSSLECTVGGMFDTVPPEARQIFQNRYPGIDMSKVIVVSDGSQSGFGMGVAVAVVSVGLIALMIGIGLLFLKYG